MWDFFLLESYTQKVDCRLSKKVLQHIHFVLTNTSHWRFRGVKISQHEKLIYGNKVYPASKLSFRTDTSKIMHHIHYHFVLTNVLWLKNHKRLPKMIVFKF